MSFFNQFHKEASERNMRKIAESKLSPTNSIDAVNYMKRNVEIASHRWLLAVSDSPCR